MDGMDRSLDKQRIFPESEFNDRLEAVRAHARSSDVDTLLVTGPENIYYLTGYQTFGEAVQFLVVPPQGQPVFLLRELESHLVGLTTYISDVRTYSDTVQPVDVLVSILSELGLNDGRLGIESESLKPSIADSLRRHLTAGVCDASGVVEWCRRVKSELEVQVCREAAKLTTAGMTAGFEAVKVGATENDVAAAVHYAMTTAGSEWLTHDPIVTSGPRSGIPHTTYARRQLAAGDVVLLEFSGCYFRYNSPLMRTCVIGEPPKRARLMYDACSEALQAAMDVITPGITSAQAHQACQDVIDQAGFTDNFRKRLGYAVGIGFKTWSEGSIFDLKADDPRLLEDGMVLHLPPALREIAEFGVGVSETILVTSTGAVPLADCSRELVCVD